MSESESVGRFDLVIIGAGINGAGIARDASMRGLKVLILDKGDIAGGTSSLSTRLIHGGLRYLEHGEFRLVQQSLRERENLLRIAPHLVKPIPILIPIYKGGRRGRLIIRAGMLAYDLLSTDKTLPRHRFMSPEETLRESPGLTSSGLLGSAVYYDCQVEYAERLVLENVLAAKEQGAQVVTYARATRVENEIVEFVTVNNEKRQVAATVIINAAGPWIDLLIPQGSKRLIGGTKGSHIVVKKFPGAPETAVYVEAESDQRPFFVIPWNGNYLIGTTDIRFEDNPDEVRAELWEVDYLLKETNRIFPDAGLGSQDVCYVYSGVRPLPFTNEVDEQSITRKHFIIQHPRIENLFSIVGGKLTTYRSLAEECVDIVFKKLGRAKPRCETSTTPLPGAMTVNDFGDELSSQLAPALIERLARVYGSRSADLLRFGHEHPDLLVPFNNRKQTLAAEIIFSFKEELATTLADCLLRRTMLGLDCDLAIQDVEAAAEICKRELGWSQQRVQDEIAEYRKTVSKMSLQH